MRIQYEAFDTNPYLPAMKPAIERVVRRLAPHWLLQLMVCGPESEFCYRNGGRGRASCQTTPEYFSAAIGIHDKFMSDPPDERLRSLIHEIAHLYTSPHYDSALGWLGEDRKKEFYECEQHRWLEFATVSLEETLMRLLGEDEKAEMEAGLGGTTTKPYGQKEPV